MSIQFGPEWQRFGQRLQRTPQVMEQNIRRTMESSLLLIEGDARRGAPQDTRRLSGSINHQITGTYPRLVGQVGPNVRYGIVMERGRRPGQRMPPVNALIPWVRRHFVPRGASIAGRFPGRRRNAAWRGRDSELRSLAFVVARSIARKGIPAQPYMRPAYDGNLARIEAAFRSIGVRVTAYLAGHRL